jgi:putative ABC transport system substrate-binding protein
MTAFIGRREFITLLGSAAATWPFPARAQQPERMPRIGVLMGIADDPEARGRLSVFREGLRERGWTDGANIEFSYRWGAGDAELNRRLADELLQWQPDLILSNSTPITIAAHMATQTTPIVFTNVTDPVAAGVVQSLARPGGNLTGFTNFVPSLVGKWIELLKGMDRRVTRIVYLFSPETCPLPLVQSVAAAASSLSVEAAAAAVRQASEIETAISELAPVPSSGLLVLPDVFTSSNRHTIISVAARRRLSAMYPFKFHTRDGGLMSYGVEAIEPFRQAVTYVDRILRGARPSELPVQASTKWELVINLKTAKTLGLEVPLQLQQLADEIIE